MEEIEALFTFFTPARLAREPPVIGFLGVCFGAAVLIEDAGSESFILLAVAPLVLG